MLSLRNLTSRPYILTPVYEARVYSAQAIPTIVGRGNRSSVCTFPPPAVDRVPAPISNHGNAEVLDGFELRRYLPFASRRLCFQVDDMDLSQHVP